ncbi:[acyl-carrier-protein] S-malonyltransferase [Desulfacinum infernum DSM 9756]|jgi:[acyl-carrier-protein] S-malonyltransferase|uniref:Malonyl CoA-acyl carrier protein transacylase n=1 Tax=Desulfacinum infernum DSM 9756 TaxID=1121391 RepID=A0A1M4UMT7_9BACT|nr:ACP S-malonyltransferase [Desulfacinum infernum]MBC7358874.1 ACP S-malonyltransferase [Desulfacinum sp.]MBZ4658356.1 fabD [Desulfacinum sp.]SHE57968.1 [acyl-carrier-protein] S-malonyltransferase [Desulfacinum infernum DSM 9756]
MKKWVFLFPGQGSQYVGMGKDFYDQYAEVRELFEKAGDLLHMDMKKLCFEGPEEVLVQTQNVQPAITLVNIACLTVLRLHEIHPAAAAGHSLGEYSALYAAGVLDLEDTLTLVLHRGRYMHEASLERPGAMAAVMDLDTENLENVCRLCDVEVANINCADQIIITGPVEAVDRALEASAEAGAKKCIKLNVSGPWHSRCMESARDRFEPHVRSARFSEPRIPVVNNVDAKPLADAAEAPGKLVGQICGSVLWKQSMEWFLENGYDHFVEVGPKKVLRGLMRRIDRKAVVHNVEDSATLTAFLQANGAA